MPGTEGAEVQEGVAGAQAAEVTEVAAEITEIAPEVVENDDTNDGDTELAAQDEAAADADVDTDTDSDTDVDASVEDDAADEAGLDEADEASDEVEAESAPEPTGPSFAEFGLHKDVVDALARRGVTHPFPIQAATLPDAMAGKDILGRGRTGSGKTLGFGLPMLTRLSGRKARARRPLALILTPTRELAMQVHDALEPYGRILDLRMKTVTGGMSMPKQIFALERGVEILVATPGRLQDLVDRGSAVLDNVEITILDEADQMADMGFLPEVTALLDLIPAGGQRMLFSATLDKGVDAIVRKYLDNPVTHSVDPHASSVTTMSHHVLVVQPKDKTYVTAAIAARRGRTMIFVRTKFGADRVAQQLREAGVRAEALHGGMTQGARTRTLAEYKEGRTPVLVATDVAARGIHVDGIDLVLHVDPAADSKDYLHRAGRTARAGEAGAVVTLALPHQRRTVDRLMEDAGVEPTRLRVQGSNDPEMRKLTGARTLSEVKAQSVADAAVEAEAEAERLAGRIIELKAEAAELRRKAAELAEAAKNGDVPVRTERYERSDRGDRGGDRREGGYRGDRDRGSDRPPYGGDRGGDRRGGAPRGDRPSYGDRDRAPRSGDRPSYGGGDRREGGYRGDRPSGDRGPRAERPAYNDRPAYNSGDRAPRTGDRPAYGDRAPRTGDRPAYGDRAPRSGDRPSYGGGDRREGGYRGDRPSYGDRAPRTGDRPGYGSDRAPRGDRPTYNNDRPSYGDRDRSHDRAPRREGHYDRPAGGPAGDRKPRWKRDA
ncbi:DEAD/DEAH box helicase [Embleya sp. NPDC020886]|uniref:DEAD/DEAH box helicase n=1 Tax=Embleya sp. NPDC020886 TaxID=3363980 RepID=UPI0037A295B5